MMGHWYGRAPHKWRDGDEADFRFDRLCMEAAAERDPAKGWGAKTKTFAGKHFTEFY